MQISLKSVYRLILVLITLCSLPAVAHIDDAAVQAALRALYTETNGDEWSNNSGWNIPAAENIKCKMGSAPTAPPGANGLTCSDTGLLTKIYLKEVFSATKGTLPDLSALTALTSLNLSGLKLTNGVLPASIGKLTTLTALVCNYCEITTLPNEMKSLVNMRTLDLSTNAITTLPVDFGDMVEMHYLALSKNGLSTQTLPASLVKMTKLSTLNLDQNSLGTFPELLTQLVNLTTLNLRTNSMEDVVVPASIGNWQKMSFLSISGNYIAEVPDALATLTELTTLKIHGNRLTKLPEQIGNLNKLREFRVFANKLTSLPDSVCKLTSLTFWRLDSNQLQTLPSCFTALNKLYSLNLANNLFQVLPPEVLALTKLTNLDVSGNGLSSLPAGITALTILNSFSMGDNQFETLPVELSQLTSLNRLRANKNRLQSFPLFLKSLPNLAYLDIAGNMIREDLMWGVTDFTALTTLSGRYNALYASDPVMNAKIESLNNSSFPQFQTLPVSNVQALDSAGSINLSWDLPLQNASTGRRNGFFVYSGPSISGPWTQITDVPGSHEVSTTLPALEAGTQVWLTVGSYNNAHFSNNNVVVSVLAPAISVIPEASNINDPAVQTALTTIYTSTGGDNWTNKAGWSATGPIACTADGISCDGSDNVVNLNFYSNNLVGTLPPEIGNLVHLTVLTLSWNSGLDVVLTDTIGGLTQLTDLNAVAVGSFNELPVEFGQLTLLETVDITSNNCLIPSIPDSFANLVNLVDLRVSGCQLTTVPASFGSLPMLKTLDLTSQPSLSSLPAEFGNLPSLEVLQLYNDGFTEIPAAVMALPKLKTLKISRNAIVEIPDAIASLTELEILEIEDAKISVISEQIGTLSKLRNLNLEKNQLTTLPLALFDLPTLNKLYLKDNQLASISDRLGNLTTLTELLLNENQLTEIPTTIGNLVNLTRFDVSDNQLTALPVEIGNLVNVTSGDWPRRGPGFNDNLLTEIPKELGNLLLIKELWLQDNQLTTLPDEIYNLTALTKFYIYGNSIPSLSSRIGELSDLTNLVLNENPITELPDEVWSLSNLTSLGANDCQITQLNEGLGNLLKLTSLQMWGNNISSLPASIANLTHLKYLYVNDNQLEQFPEAITGLKNLKVIKMHGNKMVGELPASIVNIPLMSSHNFTLAYNALWTDDIAVQNYMSVYTSRSIWAGVERHQTWLPGNFLATASNGQANLSWDLPLHYGHSGQRTGYIIYRADTATGPFTPIEEITDAYAISTTLNTLAEGDHFLAIASYNDTHSYNKNKVISSLSPAIKISILKAVRDISLAAQPVGETSPSNTLAGTLTATDTNNATGSFSYALAVKGTSMQGLCSADTANASFSINGDQLETFMPLTPGSHDVCVQSSYVDGVTFQKTITIQVSAAPQVSSAATISIDEDSVLNFSLAATDAEGDKLSFKLKAGQSLPAWFNLQAVLDSTVTTIAGTGAAGFVDDVPALQAQFENLYGIAIDKNGVIYVSDSENNRIRKISNNGIVSTFAGSGVMGHKDDTGTLAQFARPRGLAIDDNGFLYVADRSNSVIRKISPAGVVTTLAGTVGQSGSMDDASVGDGSQATFGNIHGIAVDKQGRVYVTEASAHTIRRISVSGDVTTTFAGTAGAQGIDDDSTAGDGSQAKFNTPISVVVADDGYVYVTDKNNHRIRKISPDGSITETLLGSDMGFKDDDIVGDGAKAKIWSPYGIDMDSQGNLYLADMGNNRFRKISPDGDITAVLAGTGQDGSTDDTVPGNGTQATFLAPYELTLAGDGVVYVVDEGHHAIRKIEEFYNYTFTGTPLNADVGQFTVVVEVTDGVNIVEQTITVTVNNTNDGPTEIKISKASFLESIMVSGASAGSLSTIDVDQNDSFTYVLVSSSSAVAGTCSDDTGNTSFTLSGDKLKTAAALTAGSYGLCVQSTDSGAAAIKQTLLITVVDDVAPTVSIKNVLANSNAPFTVTFTFSEVVNNFTVEDITLGNATASAFKQNGNSYTALITPTADGEVSIVVKANVLTDASGNGNVASGIEKSQYDATAPMVNILDVPQNSNKAFTVTYQFSEAVSGFDLADVTAGLLNATASNFLAVDADTYTALITAQAEGTISIIVQAGAALDVVNNASLEATAVTSEYDITAVTVEIINAPTATNKAFTAQFNFSKAVSGFDVADIVAVNATLSDFKVISPSKYSAVVSPVAEGQVSLNIAGDSAVDVAGNANKPATQVNTIYDITAPTVAIENVEANSNAAFTARFVFSEVVTGFALADISLSNATASDFSAVDGKTYTALISPTAEGALSVAVIAEVASDAAGNQNSAATTLSSLYDITAPTLVIEDVPTHSKGGFTVTFSFSEAVSDFTAQDVLLNNAVVSLFQKVNDTSYTALIIPTMPGKVTVDVNAAAVIDIAANNNTAADQASSVYDNAAPSVGFTHLPASGETSFTVNIVFSEIVSGFGLNDISATHAQLSNLQGSGSQYSVQVSADGSGQDISLSIAADSANDIAGNGNTASAITLIEMNRSATVVIQGDAVVGQTLKAMITDEDGIEGVSITYLWLNGNTALASTAKYELTAADLGAKIRVQVSFMDVLGNPESAVSEETDTVFSSQQDALDILAAISSCVDVSDAGIYQTAGIHGVTESILPIINNAIANAESSSDIDSAAEIQALVDVILLAQDSDMDGLPDFLEGLDGRDSDGDGLADYNDNDADNDGIADGIDANLDLTDSDADGIIDVLDADVGNDCVIDMDKNDDNFDGMNDAFKQLADLNIDADGDGLANHLDLDSDNDSLLDIVETQGLDANGDGLLDALGSLAQLPLADDDSDGIPNFLDVSSNGITSDITEAGLEQHDSDGDGRVDNMLDGDKDGIMDVVDSSNKEFGALSEDLGLPSGVNEVEPDGEIKSDGGQWGYLFMLMLFNVCLYRRFIRND
ncbi:MAG: hypothetical protein HRU20_16950 [Pseudomonadales bacterium]|nr:hypothetical protein [Pseudomonadales bacterium]